MNTKTKIPETLKFTVIGVFSAMTLIFSILPLPSIGYTNLAAVMETLGAVLGSTGFLGGLGVAAGALIYGLYRPSEMFLYVLDLPLGEGLPVVLNLGFVPMVVGSISIALMMKRKDKFVFALGLLLTGWFFLAPGNKLVAAWAVWDKYLALALIIPVGLLVKKTFKKDINLKYLPITLFMVSFIGLELDAMTGNVIFGYTYTNLGLTAEGLASMYVPFALAAAWERIAMAIVSTIVTLPLVYAVDMNPRIRWLIFRDSDDTKN